MPDQQPPQQPAARPVGTQQQHNEQLAAINPTAPTQADENEQAQYTQFVSRFIMAVSDPHSKLGDESIRMMNNSSLTVPVAVGRATASVAFIIVQGARAQHIEYAADVLFHACFECVCTMYVLGLSAGIFKDVPPFKGLLKDGAYPFDPKELHILVSAQMQAVRAFGDMELKHGLISKQMRQANMQFWHQQIEREVKSGIVNDDVLKKLASAGVFKASQNPAAQQQAARQPAQPQAPTPMMGDNGQPAQNASQLPPA